jgi:hypothetical protein
MVSSSACGWIRWRRFVVHCTVFVNHSKGGKEFPFGRDAEPGDAPCGISLGAKTPISFFLLPCDSPWFQVPREKTKTGTTYAKFNKI